MTHANTDGPIAVCLETMRELHRGGAVDDETMARFEEKCRTPPKLGLIDRLAEALRPFSYGSLPSTAKSTIRITANCRGEREAMNDLDRAIDEATAAIEAYDAGHRSRAFEIGDRVEKKIGTWWAGKVVGYYSTADTPVGYCVQMDTVKHGPVQIYPEAALETARDENEP